MNPVRPHFSEWKNHVVREGGCAQERALDVKTKRLDFTKSLSWRTTERGVRHSLLLLVSRPPRWQVCQLWEETVVAGERGWGALATAVVPRVSVMFRNQQFW